MGRKKSTTKKTASKKTTKKVETKVEAPQISKGQAKGLIDTLEGKTEIVTFANDHKIDITGLQTRDEIIAKFYEHFGIDADTEVEEITEEQADQADQAEDTPVKEKTPEEQDEVDVDELDLPEVEPKKVAPKKAKASKPMLKDINKYFANRKVRVNQDRYEEGDEIDVTEENLSIVQDLIRKQAIKKGRIG